MRRATAARTLWRTPVLAVFLSFGCAGAEIDPVEPDLRSLDAAYRSASGPPAFDRDGNVVLPLRLLAIRELEDRLTSRGTAVLPRALDLARREPRLAYAALSIIAAVLLDAHPGPFEVLRGSGRGLSWVVRWPTGEGKRRLRRDEVDACPSAARADFEEWLLKNGYLEASAGQGRP